MSLCSYSKELGFTASSSEGSGGDGGDANVTVKGTDESSLVGTRIIFKSAEDANVEVKVVKQGGKKVVTLGVYYL